MGLPVVPSGVGLSASVSLTRGEAPALELARPPRALEEACPEHPQPEGDPDCDGWLPAGKVLDVVPEGAQIPVAKI
jgi:hypothetical protein